MKLEYIVEYDKSSDKFNIGHCRRTYIFNYMLYMSALEHARVLILCKYVLLGPTDTLHKYCHA